MDQAQKAERLEHLKAKIASITRDAERLAAKGRHLAELEQPKPGTGATLSRIGQKLERAKAKIAKLTAEAAALEAAPAEAPAAP